MGLRKIIICVVFVLSIFILVGVGGMMKAEAIGGRFPVSYWLVDATFALLAFASSGGFYLLLKLLFEKLFKTERKVLKNIRDAVLTIIALGVICSFLLAYFQTHPFRTACLKTPADYGLKFQTVTLTSNGNRLSGWFVSGDGTKQPIVMVTHGLGSNKDNFLGAVMDVQSLGFDTFILDFHGHGDSDGYSTTFGITEADDLKAGYDWLKTQYPDRPVYAIGYSMGGAAVIRAAALYNIFDRIIVDSTYSRLEDVFFASNSALKMVRTPAWAVIRFWGWLLCGVNFDKNQPDEFAAHIAPRLKLIIHGTSDRMIPYSESVRLQSLTGGKSELWLVSGSDHVQALHDLNYLKHLRKALLPSVEK